MNVPEVYLGDTSLIIATYNEEESLSFVLEEIQNYNLGEIIIVDGNSTDKTEQIANKFNTKFFTQSKKGWGNAVREAIDEASCEYIVYMDGDGSYNPNAILEMKSLIGQYDIVFSSRYKGGTKSPDDTPIRALGNMIFTFLVKLLFKCEITDALFFYPLSKKSVLKSMDFSSQDFTLCLELPALAHSQNLRYTEILSEERERYAGVTKVNALTDGIKILKGMISLWIRI